MPYPLRRVPHSRDVRYSPHGAAFCDPNGGSVLETRPCAGRWQGTGRPAPQLRDLRMAAMTSGGIGQGHHAVGRPGDAIAAYTVARPPRAGPTRPPQRRRRSQLYVWIHQQAADTGARRTPRRTRRVGPAEETRRGGSVAWQRAVGEVPLIRGRGGGLGELAPGYTAGGEDIGHWIARHRTASVACASGAMSSSCARDYGIGVTRGELGAASRGEYGMTHWFLPNVKERGAGTSASCAHAVR